MGLFRIVDRQLCEEYLKTSDCLYASAKSMPMDFSIPGVLICSIQVAGFSPSFSLGTPGKACRLPMLKMCTQQSPLCLSHYNLSILLLLACLIARPCSGAVVNSQILPASLVQRRSGSLKVKSFLIEQVDDVEKTL